MLHHKSGLQLKYEIQVSLTKSQEPSTWNPESTAESRIQDLDSYLSCGRATSFRMIETYVYVQAEKNFKEHKDCKTVGFFFSKWVKISVKSGVRVSRENADCFAV